MIFATEAQRTRRFLYFYLCDLCASVATKTFAYEQPQIGKKIAVATD